jgi:hypothetical protein
MSLEARKILEETRTLQFGGAYQGDTIILAEILVLLRELKAAGKMNNVKKTPKEKVAV